MKKIIASLIGLAGNVLAYANASKTDAYLKLTGGQPVQAFTSLHQAAWGDWFFFLLAAGPYFGMVVSQQSFHIATIWMIVCLAAYGWLIPAIPSYIFYLVIAVWICGVLYKLLSPIYEI